MAKKKAKVRVSRLDDLEKAVEKAKVEIQTLRSENRALREQLDWHRRNAKGRI